MRKETFDGSMVFMVVCGSNHTLAVTDAGALWSCGQGEYAVIGHNKNTSRLIRVLTRVDAGHFDSTNMFTTRIALMSRLR